MFVQEQVEHSRVRHLSAMRFGSASQHRYNEKQRVYTTFGISPLMRVSAIRVFFKLESLVLRLFLDACNQCANFVRHVSTRAVEIKQKSFGYIDKHRDPMRTTLVVFV